MRIGALALCLIMSFALFAEDVRTVSRSAYDAYQAKDWPTYLEAATKLDQLRPNHPRVLYNLSGALALNGEADDAISTLSRVAAMGLVYPAAKDEDFASILDDPRFESILKRFEANGRETGNATVAITIDSLKGAVPEDVARNPVTGDVFVGLVRDRALWRVPSEGEPAKIDLGDGIWSVMGMTFDKESGTLWFCTTATPMMRDKDADNVGSSAVIAWDTNEGKIAGRWDLTPDDAPHWLGDLTLDANGTVYTTDSRTPAIYRIEKGSKKIENWLTNEGFASLQGLAWSEETGHLYVADYSRGVWSIDPESGEATLLPTPDDATVLGIDGLYHHDGTLIGVQNGTAPHRIIRLHLDANGSAITEVETLEANRPQFDEPTLGFVEDGWFWFVATSQWGSFSDDGVLKEGAEAKPVVVMKRKL